MLNRTLAPSSFLVEKFESIQPEKETFSNGLKVFSFDAGEQDLVRIEWIFENNYDQNQENSLLNSCLSSLILEGTSRLSNAEIADEVDFYGAYLVPEFSADHSTLTLFTLNKHLPRLLPLVLELLTDATFPEKEVNTHRRNSKQRLEIALKKNDFSARRLFNNILFGDSRYGRLISSTDYDQITTAALKDLYFQQFRPENCVCVLAGKVSSQTMDLMRLFFDEKWQPSPMETTKPKLADFPALKSEFKIETRQDALQSAIRLGYRSIQRAHPDFPGLQVVNTLLGGYFGSRLMANIREDKGYTYGIGSGIVSLRNAAFFTISTEVGVDVTAATLSEIEKEINLLRTIPVKQEELDLVRNYMMGSLLGSLENVFSHADKFKQAYFSGLGLEYFAYYQDIVQQIDASKVQELAVQYLDFDLMEKVIVGQLTNP